MEIRNSYEKARGCGFRKKGGVYFVAPSLGQICPALPYKLEICPACGGGIKPARGWTWVNAKMLFPRIECGICNECFVREEEAGLIWIGEKFYKTPAEFLEEAKIMGVSRRIKAVPRGFQLGQTYVLLAHRKCIPENNELKPGIFTAFKPKAIEYIVKGEETEEQLEAIVKRGIDLVNVIPIKEGA